jgi:hypothetical protein
VEKRPKAALGLVVGLAIALLTGTAQAQQLTVTVTVDGTQTTSPGSTVDAGQFTVANGFTTNLTITSVQLSISNPNLFTSMTIGATGSDNVVQTASVPLQTISTITFANPVALNLNQTAASFDLTATIAGGATATPTTAANAGGVDFASIVWPHAKNASRGFLLSLGLVAIGLLWMDGRLRRRHLVMLLLALVLAAAEAGCGNCNNSLFGCGGGSNTGTGSSDQQVTLNGIGTGGVSVHLSGTPADLGTITSQN